jgi:phage tail sheath protein FI
MTTYLSPGAYANEVDVSAYAARIASTVLALVGVASKGPVGVPTLLTSQSNAANIFGKPPAIGTSKARFGMHAVMNALSKTSQVWYTRVTDGTEAFASADSPIVVNSQVLYLAKDDSGITINGGQLAFAIQVFKRSGSFLGSDAFDALVRRFGASNIFTAAFAPITTLDELNAAITGSGAFVQVLVPMASATKTFENYDQFTNRFNRLMVDAPLRAENILVEDNVNGVQKFIAIKTANLADLVALNLEFKLVDDTSSVSPNEPGYATNAYDGGTPYSQLQLTAKKPGIAGNGISVTFVDVGNTFTGLPPVSVSGREVTVNINETVTTAAEVLSALAANTTARLIVTAANGAGSDGSGLIDAGTVTLVNGGTNLPQGEIVNPVDESIGTINLSSTRTKRLDYTNSLKLHFKASSPGEYANSAKMYFGHDDSGLMTVEYRETNELGEKAVNLRIQPSGVSGSFIDALEGFSGISPLAAADITLLSDSTSLTTALGGIDVISDVAAKSFLTWNAYEFYTSQDAAFTGGESGIPEDYNDLVDAVIGNPADNSGLYGYANRETYDNSILAAPGFDQAAVVRAGLSICEGAGDLIYIVDPPSGSDVTKGLSPQDVVDWHNGRGFGNSAAFNSSFGALYYGWLPVQDLFNGGTIWVPPSVCVLEQIAYSDNVGEVWFAPAGFKRGRLVRALGIQGNAVNNQGDRDFMYSNGNAVNPIVNFPKDGVVIFGQRTLQRAASALDRVNVRRMLNYIKRTSVAAVRPELFDPNDAVLWASLVKILTPIYQEVKNKRGLNNFLVKIDAQTTSSAARDNNEVYGYIVVEPTKAAEKIILSFVITAQGANFTEALAAVGVV